MEFELNCPIKYVVYKVIKKNDITFDIDSFIVSKCYVLNDVVDYSHGESKQYFNVVYACELDKFNNIVLNKPKYDEFGDCINMHKVNNLYDTYSDAKHDANGLNLYLIENIEMLLSNTNTPDEIEAFKIQKIKEIEEYNKLEQQMLNTLNDVKITKKKVRRLKKER